MAADMRNVERKGKCARIEMRTFPRIALLSLSALALAAGIQSVLAHGPASFSVKEIAQALKGKTCVTKGGARFTFADDGRYSYDGLWRSEGRYLIVNGAVIVTFVSGLERSFAISRKNGVLSMEETALTCAEGATP